MGSFSWFDITDAVREAFTNLGVDFIEFIPRLIGAIIILLIGWFIAVAIGKVIAEILKRIKFNQLFDKGIWKNALARAEIKVDASDFVGAIVKWILFLLGFLPAAVKVLNLTQFESILNGVLGYVPNVIVATLIFVVTVIIVDIVEKIVRASVEGIKVGYGQLVSAIVKWAIWIFAILAILQQLRFEAADWIFELVKYAFIGLVLMFAIAFGLGGKDIAAETIRDLKGKLKE